MRIVRVGLVLSVLVVLIGDGRPAPPKIPVPIPGDALLDLFPGARVAATFWYSRTGDRRRSLSVPADARMLAAYGRTMKRARTLEFRFDPPALRQTKPELLLLLGPGIRYFFAVHYTGPRTILVNSWWADQMTDAELEVLLAHELGHAIDAQNERRGAFLLDLFAPDDDDDMVADVLARLMSGPGRYAAFEKKYMGKSEER